MWSQDEALSGEKVKRKTNVLLNFYLILPPKTAPGEDVEPGHGAKHLVLNHVKQAASVTERS